MISTLFKRDRFFWSAFLLCAIALCVPIWVVKYLPMVDLPQHAAQVSVLRHLNDALYGYPTYYKINWLTPYMTGFFVAAFFALFFKTITAVKIVLTLAALGTPFAMYFLLKETRGDVWWSLLAFPLFFGHGFYWGFYPYIVAIPIGIATITLSYRYAKKNTWRMGLCLAAMMVLLFLSHGIVFGFCMIICGLVCLGSLQNIRQLGSQFLPFLAPLPFLFYWYFPREHGVPHPGDMELIPLWWGRIFELCDNLLSKQGDPFAKKFAYGLLASVAIAARPRLDWKALLPALGAFFIYFNAPGFIMDISLIYQRLPELVVLCSLGAFAVTSSLVCLTISRVLLFSLVIVWMGVLSVRFMSFDVEARDLDKIIECVPYNQKIMSLVYDKDDALIAEAYRHFTAWVQAEKGGVCVYSFSFLYNSLAQFKTDNYPMRYSEAASLPGGFDWEYLKDLNFDYYVVRSMIDRSDIFEDSHGQVVLDVHAGDWWGYRRIF